MGWESVLTSAIGQGIKYVLADSDKNKDDTKLAKPTESKNPYLDSLMPKPGKGLIPDARTTAPDSMQEKLKKADAVGLDFWQIFNSQKPNAGPDYMAEWSKVLGR